MADKYMQEFLRKQKIREPSLKMRAKVFIFKQVLFSNIKIRKKIKFCFCDIVEMAKLLPSFIF